MGNMEAEGSSLKLELTPDKALGLFRRFSVSALVS
jgi:hypothetical protein